VPAQRLDVQDRAANDTTADLRAMKTKNGRVCHGAKLSERTFLRDWNVVGVEGQKYIKDRRMGRQRRSKRQRVIERRLVGPDKPQPIAEALKLPLELLPPVLLKF